MNITLYCVTSSYFKKKLPACEWPMTIFANLTQTTSNELHGSPEYSGNNCIWCDSKLKVVFVSTCQLQIWIQWKIFEELELNFSTVPHCTVVKV